MIIAQELRSIFTLGVLLTVSACRIEDIDVTGKRCSESAPCPGNFNCVDGRCEVPSDGGGGCIPKFKVEGFRR